MAEATKSVFGHRKLALLIANGDYYRPENKLINALEMVKLLDETLRAINFEVTTICDLTKEEMATNVNNFTRKVCDGDLLLMYFHGHSYSVHRKNYLIPIDDKKIESLRDVEDFGFDIEPVIFRLAKRNPSFASVFVLDCCRFYMLKRGLGVIPISRSTGFHEMEAPRGTFIQLSCAANQASDNNLFGKHLLETIAQENVEISAIFQDISNKVYTESNNQQRPFSMNGLQPGQQVYLNGVEVSTEQFLTTKPLTIEEKSYYEECKEYYHLTKQPIITIADEIWDSSTEIASSALKIGIDVDHDKLQLTKFLMEFCTGVGLSLGDITMKQIQVGSAIVEAGIFNNAKADEKKVRLRVIGHRMTRQIIEQLAMMSIFFVYMGPIDSYEKIPQRRAEIRLNPSYNRIYAIGQHYWIGPIQDGRDRGNKPYFCPVGWQRWSFHVTDDFDEKFTGWCISYHGTQFANALSILLSGLKPATVQVYGEGIYVTPSVNYAAHPRYAEVKRIDNMHRKFFKFGDYVQIVLECRVHPRNIIKIGQETLLAAATRIDPNIENSKIEWLVDHQGKSIVDFNDPDASIVCTGILKRVTKGHPGLLPQSAWWHTSHLCDDPRCCKLGIDTKLLAYQRAHGYTCDIIFN